MSVIGHLATDERGVELTCLIDVDSEDCETILEEVSSGDVLMNTSGIDVDGVTVHDIHIPDVFSDVESRMQFVIATALSQEYLQTGDEVNFVMQLPIVEELMVTTVTATHEFVDEDITALFFDSQPSTETIQQTLSVAISLGKTGQKGDPVGILFVVGDENDVLSRSRPLNHNPFTGADVHVSDEVVSASLGEFAKLDGAFVIADDGQVVSSNRYLEPAVHDAEVPSGLGARHMAASGITESTDAVSIVVSESDQKVRCFVDGEIVISADPNDANVLV